MTLFRNITRTLRHRKAERDLRGLPDYLLKDIGVSRGQIPFIVRIRNDRGEG